MECCTSRLIVKCGNLKRNRVKLASFLSVCKLSDLFILLIEHKCCWNQQINLCSAAQPAAVYDHCCGPTNRWLLYLWLKHGVAAAKPSSTGWRRSRRRSNCLPGLLAIVTGMDAAGAAVVLCGTPHLFPNYMLSQMALMKYSIGSSILSTGPFKSSLRCLEPLRSWISFKKIKKTSQFIRLFCFLWVNLQMISLSSSLECKMTLDGQFAANLRLYSSAIKMYASCEAVILPFILNAANSPRLFYSPPPEYCKLLSLV